MHMNARRPINVDPAAFHVLDRFSKADLMEVVYSFCDTHPEAQDGMSWAERLDIIAKEHRILVQADRDTRQRRPRNLGRVYWIRTECGHDGPLYVSKGAVPDTTFCQNCPRPYGWLPRVGVLSYREMWPSAEDAATPMPHDAQARERVMP